MRWRSPGSAIARSVSCRSSPSVGEAEAGDPVLHDLALAAAVENDRQAAVLHGFDGRHAEVLHVGGIALAQAAKMPENRGAAVPGLQFGQGDIDLQFHRQFRVAPPVRPGAARGRGWPRRCRRTARASSRAGPAGASARRRWKAPIISSCCLLPPLSKRATDRMTFSLGAVSPRQRAPCPPAGRYGGGATGAISFRSRTWCTGCYR